jgi:hypothetical protein
MEWVYQFQGNKLQKIEGVEAPISALCKSKEGIYALGPKGVWLYSNHHFQKKKLSNRKVCAKCNL